MLQGQEKRCDDFAETTAFDVRELYGVKTSEKIMSTGLPLPALARLAHRGRINLLTGYVSKSSAALNILMITQLASLGTSLPSCVAYGLLTFEYL